MGLERRLQLQASTTVAKDLSSVPVTHVDQLTTSCNSSSRHLVSSVAALMYTHTKLINRSFFFFFSQRINGECPVEGIASVFCFPLYLSSRASESKGVTEAGHVVFVVFNSKQLPDSLVFNYRCLWVLRTYQV